MLGEIPAAADPTDRGLIDLADGVFGPIDVRKGLRRLKAGGLAAKQDSPWNPARRDRGNGWELTPEGSAHLAELLAKQAAYEYWQFTEDS